MSQFFFVKDCGIFFVLNFSDLCEKWDFFDIPA